jgi:short-subunit dehydrogenase
VQSAQSASPLGNRVVVVTGASAGIGAALVRQLAQRGAHVVLTARRLERLQALVTELAPFPGERLALPGDIQDEAFCRALIGETVARFGRIDVLVNNAGLGHKSDLAEMPADDARTLIGTNLYGLLFASQAAIAAMRRQGHGQIINVSSIVGQRPLPNNALYTASKTAVNFVSRALRMELRHTPLIITSVYPGRTRTEFDQAKLGGVTQRRGGVSADRVAIAICRAIEKPRREVYITLYDWLFTHLNRLFPHTTDWLFGRLLVRPPHSP